MRCGADGDQPRLSGCCQSRRLPPSGGIFARTMFGLEYARQIGLATQITLPSPATISAG
jgi:hypothetical protein